MNANIDYSDYHFMQFENSYEEHIKHGYYKNTLALLSWLVEALTYAKILPESFYQDQISLLYGEALKRIRSSNVIANKGYFSDGISILRSVFELMKAINAIQNGIIEKEEYFIGFLNHDEDNENIDYMESLEEHCKKMDSICNTFDDKQIPKDIKKSLKIFKSLMHRSIHKSQFNLYWELIEFRKNGNQSKPFDINMPKNLYELYFNIFAFILLMYLRNMVNSKYLDDIDKILFYQRIDELENSYLKMGKEYFNDIIKYIKIKYKYI